VTDHQRPKRKRLPNVGYLIHNTIKYLSSLSLYTVGDLLVSQSWHIPLLYDCPLNHFLFGASYLCNRWRMQTGSVNLFLITLMSEWWSRSQSWPTLHELASEWPHTCVPTLATADRGHNQPAIDLSPVLPFIWVAVMYMKPKKASLLSNISNEILNRACSLAFQSWWIYNQEHLYVSLYDLELIFIACLHLFNPCFSAVGDIKGVASCSL